MLRKLPTSTFMSKWESLPGCFQICKNSFVYSITPFTAWKVSKYGIFSGPYFPVFGLNIGKYGPEKTLYLNFFHTVCKNGTIKLHFIKNW